MIVVETTFETLFPNTGSTVPRVATEAEFFNTVPVASVDETATGTTYARDWPLARLADLTMVIFCPLTVSPVAATGVRPAGRVSVMVKPVALSDGPRLVTVIV